MSLLRQFGSIGELIHASEMELRACSPGNHDWIDRFVSCRRLISDGQRELVFQRPLVSRSSAFHRYLIVTMGRLQAESIRCFFCDARSRVIADEVLAEGTENEVKLSMRHTFARALSLDARRITLAHNHPSGDAEPSDEDITQTFKLAGQAASLGIVLDDHLIVGRSTVTSLKAREIL